MTESGIKRSTVRWQPPAGTQSPNKDSDDVKASSGGLAQASTVRADLSISHLNDPLQEIAPFSKGMRIGKRYVIEQHISSGSFGAVYRARDDSIPNHSIALKVLHAPSPTEKARDMALRELQLIASVSHPSVVQFKDYGWIGNTLWFTMPWYDGETLQQRLYGNENQEPSALSRAQARPIFERLAHGLAAMHDVGVFHHDIKPENIFLATVSGFDVGLPVLLDLGVAAKRGEKPTGFTADYVSPETAGIAIGNKDNKIGAAADVFSLALTLREALEPETTTAKQDDQFEFLNNRAKTLIDPPAGRDLRYLTPCFRKWLSIDPDERPNAENFASELSKLTLPEERRQARIRLFRRLVPVVLLASILVAVLAYQLTRQEKQLNAQEEQITVQQEELSIRSVETDILRQQTEDQQEQIQTESERAKQSERKAKKLDKKLNETSKAHGDLVLQLEALRTALTELQTQHEAMNEDRNLLQNDLTELVTVYDVLKTDFNSLQGQRDQLRESNNDLKTNNDSLILERDSLTARIAALDAKNQALTTQYADIQKTLAKIKSEKDRIEAERKKIEQERDRLKHPLKTEDN